MLTQAPKGTKDVLPADSYKWQYVESKMRAITARAGYREIRTPMFEHTELFLRSVGDTTDIVQKEMYTFEDKGGRSITLKPEGTASVVRAFIEGKLFAEALPAKMYYLSMPNFRYEKPQSGRFREFHQFGLEAFGASEASIDAELISIAWELTQSLGINGLALSINSIGCPQCRAAYYQTLREYLAGKVDKLCANCKARYERNPLRVLDCKEPECIAQVADAPSIIDSLCDDCRAHFESLKANLSALDIPFTVDPRIVRGLDYYTKTVFEIIAQVPGGKLTVCGGGRYNGLVQEIGGPDLPGVGFGMGVERLLMVMDLLGIEIPRPNVTDVFVCTMGDNARLAGIKLVNQLRRADVKADMDHNKRSLKAQFKFADKCGARYVIVLGEDELAQGVAKLRNMQTHEESDISLSDIDNIQKILNA